MGTYTPVALPHQSNRGRYKFESSARTINCYAENLGRDGKGPFALYAINGWETFATLAGASGGVRAMLPVDNELLVVAGRQLYSVMVDGTASLIGGIVSDGLVTMRRNRREPAQVVIVADGLWYIYQDGVLSAGVDADLPPPVYVIQKDGYFIFLHADGRWTISGIDDVTIDGLDFATASSDADGLVAGATRGTDVVLFGHNSTEFWTNTGAADFPFERQAYRGFGCYAAGSVSEITALMGGAMVDSVVWAGTDEKGAYTGVFLLNGYTAQKVSTYEIDRAILADTDPAAIRGFAWSEDGHVFYTISGTGYAWTYDTVEGLWHERRSHSQPAWRAIAHATFAGMTLFGDTTTGTIYRSKPDLYDADGETVGMEVWLPITHASPRQLVVNRFKVDAVMGVGLGGTDTHLAEPKIMLDISHDGGGNFGTLRPRDLGAAGQSQGVIAWHRLGMVREQGAVFRLRISPGVKRCVMGAAIDVDLLDN